MTREILSTRTHYTSVIVKLLLCAALLWSFTLMTASPVAATSPAQPQPFTPFLDIVPNAHGTAINITVRGAGDASVTLDGHIFDPTDPTGFKEGWTGTYSGTLSAHFAGNVGSFSPQTTVTRTLEFTTSTGLRMEPTGLNRGFLPLETEDPPHGLLRRQSSTIADHR